MKNTIYIDIDTERDEPILIGKPEGVKPPETQEEAHNMIVNDIASVCEALCRLIDMAEQNGYTEKGKLVEASIKVLSEMLEVTPPVENGSDIPPATDSI